MRALLDWRNYNPRDTTMAKKTTPAPETAPTESKSKARTRPLDFGERLMNRLCLTAAMGSPTAQTELLHAIDGGATEKEGEEEWLWLGKDAATEYRKAMRVLRCAGFKFDFGKFGKKRRIAITSVPTDANDPFIEEDDRHALSEEDLGKLKAYAAGPAEPEEAPAADA